MRSSRPRPRSRRHPRSFDDPWPSAAESDKDLRTFLATTSDTEKPESISKKAKELLGIDIEALQVEIAASSRASIAQRASSSNLLAAAKNKDSIDEAGPAPAPGAAPAASIPEGVPIGEPTTPAPAPAAPDGEEEVIL